MKKVSLKQKEPLKLLHTYKELNFQHDPASDFEFSQSQISNISEQFETTKKPLKLKGQLDQCFYMQDISDNSEENPKLEYLTSIKNQVANNQHTMRLSQTQSTMKSRIPLKDKNRSLDNKFLNKEHDFLSFVVCVNDPASVVTYSSHFDLELYKQFVDDL